MSDEAFKYDPVIIMPIAEYYNERGSRIEWAVFEEVNSRMNEALRRSMRQSGADAPISTHNHVLLGHTINNTDQPLEKLSYDNLDRAKHTADLNAMRTKYGLPPR